MTSSQTTQFFKVHDFSNISTFHPAKIYLPGITADALLDSLNPWGGCFFVMTDGECFPGKNAEERDVFFLRLSEVELEWGRGLDAWRLSCRVQGYSLDQEGLVAYMTLRFSDSDPAARIALGNFMASIW